MDKVVFCNEDYKIIHNNRNYTLINLKGIRENHGHFKKFDTCLMLIRLMKDQIVPRSKYLQNAVLRISTDEKYKQKILNKQKKLRNKPQYMNVNKGVKWGD